ncbi:MAG TPA: two-component regulator propeller domain-containing protein, partial [Chitinophagaceae bacterium]
MIILCLLLSVYSDAQYTPGNFTQYTEKDGLPGVEVTDLLVDKQGYIWLGTVNGLARYDGYTFKRFYFNPNDTNTIRGLTVWSLFEDRKGRIWVSAGPSYLNMYDPITQKFFQYKFTHLVPHRTNTEIGVTDIAEDNNGRMYFGIDTYYYDSITTPLLYKEMNEDVIKPFPVPDSIGISNIYRLKKDPAGNIWIFSWSGIFKIDKKGNLSRFRVIERELLQNKDFPGDIGFDSMGHVWIISQKLYLYEIELSTSSYKQWNDKVDLTPENEFWPRSLIVDKKNNILIGTTTGILHFDRKTGRLENFSADKKEFEGSLVRDLKFDSFGTLWIATSSAGMIKYEEKPLLRSYSYNKDDKNPFTSGWANNIYRASDGKIWITTSGSSNTSGINILDTRNNSIRSIPFSKISGRINGLSAIWENKPGEMYFAGYGAIVKFSEKTLGLDLVKIPGLPDQTIINSHLKDSRENEWLFTFSGVYKKQKSANEYKQYDLSKVTGGNSASNEVTRGFESKKHGLWILTNNGLFLYNFSTDKIERHAYDKQAGDILITQDVNS